MARVFKRIKGLLYIYEQTSQRVNGKVVTQSVYIGPATPADVQRLTRSKVTDQVGAKEGVNLTSEAVNLTAQFRMGRKNGFESGFQAGFNGKDKNPKPPMLKSLVSSHYMDEYLKGYDGGYQEGLAQRAAIEAMDFGADG